ncbi:MAG: outer membrane lipoprotein chaperone LolA [Chromatiales bacterium]
MRIETRTAIMMGAMIALFAPHAEAGTAREALDAYLADFRTLQAQFEQIVINENGKTLETSQGRVYLQRPGKFHWDYEQPYVQAIIGDGEKIWIYDQDLEQVTIRPMQNALGSTPSVILGSDTRINEKFEVREDGEKDGASWLTLLPRDAKNEYARVRLGFEGKDLRWMELFDNFGQTTRLHFSGEQRNVPIDPALFTFIPPPGVDVNDLTRRAANP